jgi:putative aldouronate transport system substrate-binding protein
MVDLKDAAPTPMEQNAAWQELNRQLGLSLNINLVPDADYPTKFAAALAGGDIPDLLQVTFAGQVQTFQGEAQFASTSLADLTPYLSGDAVKEFPNLANLPTSRWLSTVVGGRLYGVPYLSVGGVLNYALFVNQKRLDDLGVTQISSPDEFMTVCKQLTRPQSNQWAIGTYINLLFDNTFFASMFGAPYNWSASAGKLTKNLETPEYRASIEFTRNLVAAGVAHPDAFAMTLSSIRTSFANGSIAMMPGTFSNYANYWNLVSDNPQISVRTIPPIGPAGSKAPYFVRSGVSGKTVIKKSSPDRVKQLLGVMDFLAAPFGTQEHLLANYGVTGVDFNLDPRGNPIATDQGKAEFTGSRAPWFYLAAAPSVIYNPQHPEMVNVVHQDEQNRLSGTIVSDPTYGLASDTYATKGGALEQMIFDRLNAIVGSRAPMDDYDQLVRDWRAQGGDQIRGELENALANRVT